MREDKLAHKPENLSFEEAAVVPISGGTALQGLTDSGLIEAGQKVLIIGASGGVGTYAVQLAKAFGAEVTGVSSTPKVDLVRSIGADHVVDYTRDEYLLASSDAQRKEDAPATPTGSRRMTLGLIRSSISMATHEQAFGLGLLSIRQ